MKILTITRKMYRDGDPKFILKCDGIEIAIRPDRSQRYDLTELIHGGGSGEVQLPCITIGDLENDIEESEPMADSDFASWQDDPGYW